MSFVLKILQEYKTTNKNLFRKFTWKSLGSGLNFDMQLNTFKFNADFVNYLQFTSTFRIFFTLSYFNQRQVSALTMLTNVIKYISITLVLFLFMFDCLLFRSYIPYFCPRVCEGSHLHKIIIDLDQILVIEDRLIDKIHPITLKSVINYTQLQLLFSNYPIPENHIIW